MALTTFRFEASFPAHPDFLEPLQELARQVLVYTGCPDAEAAGIASDLRDALLPGLSIGHGREPLVIRFEKAQDRLTIDVAAPHRTFRVVRPPSAA